ncbi:P-loop NTPase [Microbacterium sp.]|uniref:nucleotide-binding protein n=1 Tax=Microbacterium sp. TaxID=51671 RepID=UPI0039E4B598
MRAVLAVHDGAVLADALRRRAVEVAAVVDPTAPAAVVAGRGDLARPSSDGDLSALLSNADLLVVDASREALTSALVSACDGFGVRIVARCARDAERRLATAFGVRAVAIDDDVDRLLDPELPPLHEAGPSRGRIIVVWGPAGAPGRSTIAYALAAELSRDGRRVALVDADTHAPSIALATGLPDEAPGFAAACRQVARRALTGDELSRIAAVSGDVSVLTGINRPSRWPELTADRVTGALEVCRDWVDDIVVDVASSLESDEEIVSDLDGLRRNAATLAALGAADLVVAVVAADPVGVSRFVRAQADLVAAVGATPVRVLVNKTRSGVLGIDPRGQVRRTLDRYLGIVHVWFAPFDVRAVDAAVLEAQPLMRVAGRSALTAAVRRFVGEAIDPPRARRVVPASGRRRRRRGERLTRRAVVRRGE